MPTSTPSLVNPPKPGEIYLHIKRGGLYRVVCIALVEATLEQVVVYASMPSSPEETPVHWIRPLGEFTDGRFQWIGRLGGANGRGLE